jgi:hypothetical protein
MLTQCWRLTILPWAPMPVHEMETILIVYSQLTKKSPAQRQADELKGRSTYVRSHETKFPEDLRLGCIRSGSTGERQSTSAR